MYATIISESRGFKDFKYDIDKTKQRQNKDKDSGTDGTKDVLQTSTVCYIFEEEKTGCSGILDMAFPPKHSTKIFHQNFFSTKHFQSVYSYSEYLSFAQFTWSSLVIM